MWLAVRDFRFSASQHTSEFELCYQTSSRTAQSNVVNLRELHSSICLHLRFEHSLCSDFFEYSERKRRVVGESAAHENDRKPALYAVRFGMISDEMFIVDCHSVQSLLPLALLTDWLWYALVNPSN